MSYCRWSGDNWKCDLYCYEDVNGGWTTHIAARRRTGEIVTDRVDDFITHKITAEEYIESHRKHMMEARDCPMEDIDLPHAGESFNDPTLDEFKDRLIWLRGLGYNFPDYVLEMVDEEMREEEIRDVSKN